jgi:hypothetical protein
MGTCSIDQLITLAVTRIRSVEARLQQIELINFPSKNPRILISLFSRILQALSEQLTTYHDDFANETDNSIRERIRSEVQNITFLIIQAIAAHLRYVEGASFERTPWNFVEPIEKLAQEILKEARFVVRPRWLYNFSILEIVQPYKKVLTSLLPPATMTHIFDDLPEKLYIVSFPGLERSNVLLHVNFGHEIGHQIQDVFFSSEDSSYLVQIREEVEEELKNQYPDEVERSAEAAQRTDTIAKVRKRALEELMADLFSLKLFGPAAIFALHEIPMLTGSFDDIPVPDSFYPPWRMRLREVFKEANWAEIEATITTMCSTDLPGVSRELADNIVQQLTERMNLLESLTSEVPDQHNIDRHLTLRIAYKSVADALPKVRLFLTEQFGAHSCPVDESFWADVFHLVGRLDRNIPPNEIIGPDGTMRIADIRRILNSGWLYKVTKLSSMYTNGIVETQFCDDLHILNNLVLKAVEMSDLQKEYTNYKLRKA